jgi:hypothetical protein
MRVKLCNIFIAAGQKKSPRKDRAKKEMIDPIGRHEWFVYKKYALI